MLKHENEFPLEITPCAQCGKEVPLSEAKVAEAVDYVAYFCGLQCYAKWATQAETAELPSSKTDAPILNRPLTDANGNVAANEQKLKHLDAALDEALTESFPASDPIAINFSRAVASNSSWHLATMVTPPKPKSREIQTSLAQGKK
jgi:hypothetical protein